METAGIIIDNWKLPIFERHLTQAGYSFEKPGGPGGFTEDTMVLMVDTENIEALHEVVKAANKEAARTKSGKT